MNGAKILKKGLRSGSLKSRLIGVFFVLLFSSAIIIVWTEQKNSMSTFELITTSSIAGLFVAAGITSIILSYSHRFKEHPLLAAIREKHSNFIVWIYPFTSKSNRFSIYAYNENGKLYNIYTQPKYEAVLLSYLQEHFPNAKTGFKEEYKKILRKKPKELLRPNPTLI